jgi:L-malate glycosyltransferase
LKQNVLHLIGSFHSGGSERQALQLARLLRDEGSCRVSLAVLNGDGALRAEAERYFGANIPAFPLASFYDANFLRQIRRLAAFIKEQEIALVHAHDFYTNVFGMTAARLAGTKARIASKRETGEVRSSNQKIAEKQAFRLARAVVANAAAVKKYLIENGSAKAEKISVIYNGLDFKRFENLENASRRQILESLSLPPDRKLVAIVANFRHAVKNQEMFLRAARIVKEKHASAAFVLAGEGERLPAMKQLAAELEIETDAFFVGSSVRVAELLTVSCIGVLASRAEGFSNSILEYMAAGLPVVATDVGGAREAVVDAANGFIVRSDDERAMAENISYLLENEEIRRAMGERNKRKAKENFSCQSQREKTLALYEKLWQSN